MTKAKSVKVRESEPEPAPLEVKALQSASETIMTVVSLPGELKRFRCPFCTVQIGDEVGGCAWCKPVKAKLVF